MSGDKELTKGNIGSTLLLFSLPMICGNILQQLYQVADTIIVGKTLGAAALSAVGSSYALMVLLTSITLGLCMGSGVVFAQLYGGKRIEEMKIAFFNSLLFILAFTFLLNLTAYLLLENCLIWLSIPSEAIEYTRDYLQVMFLGLGFVALYNFFAAVLRSIGNTLVPLIFLAISAVVNIALDLLFILVFRWEEMGAAAATVIAQALSAVCLILYFFKTEKQFLPQKKHCHYHPGLLWEIIKNSALTALQQSVMNLGILMVQGLVNRFGFAASAAFAAVVKIDAFAYLPAQDFGNGFATFVAQNYGAGNEERILRGKRIAIGYTTAFCILSSVLVLLFSKELMLLFVEQGETEILEIGIQYLHIEGAFYFAIGILFLLYGYYRGLGKPWISLKLTIISLGTRVALAYLLSAIPQVGLTGIWWAVPIGWILADLVGLFQAAPKQRANIDQAAHK